MIQATRRLYVLARTSSIYVPAVYVPVPVRFYTYFGDDTTHRSSPRSSVFRLKGRAIFRLNAHTAHSSPWDVLLGVLVPYRCMPLVPSYTVVLLTACSRGQPARTTLRIRVYDTTLLQLIVRYLYRNHGIIPPIGSHQAIQLWNHTLDSSICGGTRPICGGSHRAQQVGS